MWGHGGPGSSPPSDPCPSTPVGGSAEASGVPCPQPSRNSGVRRVRGLRGKSTASGPGEMRGPTSRESGSFRPVPSRWAAPGLRPSLRRPFYALTAPAHEPRLLRRQTGRLAQGREAEASSGVSSAPTRPTPTPSQVSGDWDPTVRRAGCVPGPSQRPVPQPPGAMQSLLAWQGSPTPAPRGGSRGPRRGGRMASPALLATAAPPRTLTGLRLRPHLPPPISGGRAPSLSRVSPDSVLTSERPGASSRGPHDRQGPVRFTWGQALRGPPRRPRETWGGPGTGPHGLGLPPPHPTPLGLGLPASPAG